MKKVEKRVRFCGDKMSFEVQGSGVDTKVREVPNQEIHRMKHSQDV